MRDAAFACIRRVGVETGGSNVQFALNPAERRHGHHRDEPAGEPLVGAGLEGHRLPDRQDRRPARRRLHARRDPQRHHQARRRPASSRSSTTSSPRSRAGRSRSSPAPPACSAPRCSRWARPWPSAAPSPSRCRRALRSLEHGPPRPQLRPGRGRCSTTSTTTSCCAGAAIATPDRPFQLEAALRRGISRRRRLRRRTRVDPWFLDQILMITEERAHLAEIGFAAMTRAGWRRAKRLGFSDAQLAYLWARRPRPTVRGRPPGRRRAGHVQDGRHLRAPSSRPTRRTTTRPTRTRTRSARATGRKVVILGSGPNRIGQGIEFDYCCVHASFALRDAGFETIMVNCNPETVSTDYDTSDRLYFEPLTYEDVMNVIEAEQARIGRHRRPRRPDPAEAGRPAARASSCSAPVADVDRPGRGPRALERPVRPARDPPARRRHRGHHRRGRWPIVERIGYPVLMRPSLRARRPGHGDRLRRRGPARGPWPSWPASAASGKEGGLSAERPVLVDRFLEDATEVDVDAIRDHTGEVLIGGVMEHVEEAGVHSGDSRLRPPAATRCRPRRSR